MQAHLKFALIAFLVLWLPLQGATALAMPMCVHMLNGDTGPGVTQAAGTDLAYAPVHELEDGPAAVHHHDAGGHGTKHDHSGAGHHESPATGESASVPLAAGTTDMTADSHDAGCNECGLCQLACASVLLSTNKSFFITSPGAFVEMVSVSFLSITPSLLQRPPLAT